MHALLVRRPTDAADRRVQFALALARAVSLGGARSWTVDGNECRLMHADELDDGLAIQVAYQRRHLAIVEHRYVEALARPADIDAHDGVVGGHSIRMIIPSRRVVTASICLRE